MRTYGQMKSEREEADSPIAITEAEWAILADGWVKENEHEQAMADSGDVELEQAVPQVAQAR